MTDLDVVLMGGQYSSSTSDLLNSFIVGIQSGHNNEQKSIILALGKVSSGLSSIQLDTVNQKLKSEGKLFDNNRSSRLVFGKETPNYFIEPENSLVFVVRATELTRCTDASYQTPYTLRFPRILKVRTDKPVEDCLKMNELLELTSQNKAVIKLNKRNVTLEEILEIKTRQVTKRTIEVVPFEDTRQKCDLLEEYRINVFNGTAEKDRYAIEALIKRAGGKVVYRKDETVDIVLIGDYNNDVKKLCTKRQHFDVINVKWLYRVLHEGELLSYQTLEVYSLGTNIKNCLSDELDRYADSYTEDATLETLEHCFDLLQNLKEESLIDQLMRNSLSRNFKNCVAYFDKYRYIGNSSSGRIYNSQKDEFEFMHYGGKVVRTITADTKLIITRDKTDQSRLEFLQKYLETVNRSDIVIKDKFYVYE